MENLSIDLSMLATSLKALRENTTYSDFDAMLKDIREANDHGKLEEFLSQVEYIYKEGTDLVSAFQHAMFDIVHEPGEKI